MRHAATRLITPWHRAVGVVLLLVMLGYDAVATGWLGFNERVVAMCRNVVLPGLGFIETQPWLTAPFVLFAAASLVAWMRWGTDWIVGAVWLLGVVLAFALVPTEHRHAAAAAAASSGVRLAPLRASHEFAAVLVLVTMLSRARLAVAGLPGVRRIVARRIHEAPDAATALLEASPVERCRAIAIAALAHVPNTDGALAAAPDVVRRAGRVDAWARWRVGGRDPLRHDCAHARAALALTGELDPSAVARFTADAQRSPLGVPASEPTWARLLDGTLAAIALERLGHGDVAARWQAVLAGPLRLRHGRRHSAVHVPTLLRITIAPTWEHAAATALARTRGWITADDDWVVLRRPSLAAAARGGRRTEDARLVAAARIWAGLVDDAEALAILHRPTRSTDPIAAALHAVADGRVLDAA